MRALGVVGGYARAKDQPHAQRLREIGVASAVPETLEASLQLAGQVLSAEGVDEDAVANRLAHQRRAEIARLAETRRPPAAAAR